jgi:hypothetical protein
MCPTRERDTDQEATEDKAANEEAEPVIRSNGVIAALGRYRLMGRSDAAHRVDDLDELLDLELIHRRSLRVRVRVPLFRSRVGKGSACYERYSLALFTRLLDSR